MLGKVFGYLMNKINNDLNKFMLHNLLLDADDEVLEVGFGDGKLIVEIAEKLNRGKVVGLDFSETMVRRATKNNRKGIAQGKVELYNASIESMPLDAGSFNKICSANTIYFWPEPDKNIKELYRLLKKNGRIVLGFRTKQQLERQSFSKHGFTLYEMQDVKELLNIAGFSEVEIVSKPSNKLESYCAIATKK